jgi:hypothetical protein
MSGHRLKSPPKNEEAMRLTLAISADVPEPSTLSTGYSTVEAAGVAHLAHQHQAGRRGVHAGQEDRAALPRAGFRFSFIAVRTRRATAVFSVVKVCTF